jgi:phenylacetate-coenzyme A ligase PaaK-like adenylate-forming protein
MQNWNKKGMTFILYSNFDEFIPREEPPRSELPAPDAARRARTRRGYELIVTNLLGEAFVRYRIGDFIKITSIGDSETGSRRRSDCWRTAIIITPSPR